MRAWCRRRRRPAQVRVFFHYPPQFYHLHAHFTALSVEGAGCLTERAVLLDDGASQDQGGTITVRAPLPPVPSPLSFLLTAAATEILSPDRGVLKRSRTMVAWLQ